MPGKVNEKLWARAKAAVRKQYPKVKEGSDRWWRLVQAIYQRMTGDGKGGGGSSKKPPLGSGKRFARLVTELRKRGSVRDPKAVAAAIGRKKYGKTKFQRLASAGRKRKGR